MTTGPEAPGTKLRTFCVDGKAVRFEIVCERCDRVVEYVTGGFARDGQLADHWWVHVDDMTRLCEPPAKWTHRYVPVPAWHNTNSPCVWCGKCESEHAEKNP